MSTNQSFGVGLLTPRTMFAPDGEVHDFIRGQVKRKDYLPKVIKYNLDAMLNSNAQTVITNYGFKEKNKNIYALLRESTLSQKTLLPSTIF